MAEISEKSFPFDSELINGKEDRLYLADDFAAYFRSFISSGIFMKEASNLQVIANGDMTVTLKPGKMIIDGYGYENTNDIVIQLDPADGVLDRIDRISVTWSQGDRDIHYTLQSSEYSYDPLEPECRRTAEYKDYVVADIRVSAGAISISQENITDQRLNSEVCGLAIPFAEVDTSEINAKLQAYYERAILENDQWREDERAELMSWFEDIKGKLAEDIGVNLQLQIDEITQNHQLRTYLSPKLMDSTKDWSNFKLSDLKAGRKLVATLAAAEDISNAYANGVIPVAVAGTLTGINANNTGYYQYVTITGETYINSSESILGNVFTGWKQMVDILTTREEMQGNTLPGKVVDALVVKDIDSSLTDLGGFKPVIDETTGEITGYKTTIGGADTVFPFSGEQILTFTGYQYYSSNICMLSPKNLSSLKVVQRKNEPLMGYYYDKFGNGSSTQFLNISASGTYEIDLSNMPSNTVLISIYYSGNESKNRAIDFDVIVKYD